MAQTDGEQPFSINSQQTQSVSKRKNIIANQANQPSESLIVTESNDTRVAVAPR